MIKIRIVLALGFVLLFSGCTDLDHQRSSFSDNLKDSDNLITFGDMLLDKEQAKNLGIIAKTESESQNVSSLGVSRSTSARSFWPNGLVPIVFDSSVSTDTRRLFMKICREFSEFSDVLCTSNQSIINSRASHVLVTKDSNLSCGAGFASLGYRGENVISGSYRLRFGTGNRRCSEEDLRYVLTHEFLHILGFLHAHSHPKRDEHLIIYSENVPSNRLNNFRIYNDSLTPYDTDYDKDSIMHYAGTGFAKRDDRGSVLTSIRPKTNLCASYPAETPSRNLPRECQISLNREISALDVESVVLAYGRPTSRTANERELIVNAPQSCQLDGQTFEHDRVSRFYNVRQSENCLRQYQFRKCIDGEFSGTSNYRFSSCTNVSVEDDSEQKIKEIYLNLLERPADPGGLEYYSSLLRSGVSLGEIERTFKNSDEYKNLQRRKEEESQNNNSHSEIIKRLYLEVLERNADPGGLRYYTSLLASGTSEVQIRNLLKDSDEYRALHKSNSEKINLLYIEVLQRPADPGGLSHYTSLLDSGHTIEQIRDYLKNSDEYRNLR